MPTHGPRHNQKYGAHHRWLRRYWRQLLDAGHTVACARCGQLVDRRDEWDLGHRDGGGPRDYTGPEHRACNRATSTHRTAPADPAPAPRTRW